LVEKGESLSQREKVGAAEKSILAIVRPRKGEDRIVGGGEKKKKNRHDYRSACADSRLPRGERKEKRRVLLHPQRSKDVLRLVPLSKGQ